MNCIVAGASGLVGQHLLHELALEERIDAITVVARTPLFQKNDKVRLIKTSFEQLELVDLPEAQAAFCCLGTTIKKAGSQDVFFRVDHDYVLNFAKRCKEAGVNTFIYISAHGADPKSKIFYNRVKGQTEKDLESLGFDRLTILRPSLLLGDRKESRPFEKAAQMAGRILRPLMIGRLHQAHPIEASQVAKKMRLLALEANTSKLQVVPNYLI